MIKMKTVHDSIEDIFLKRNGYCKREELNWRADERLEWVCEHGTGHTVFSVDEDWIHGCCYESCCKDLVTFSIKFNVPKSREVNERSNK